MAKIATSVLHQQTLGIGVAQFLDDFHDYLTRVKDLAPTTIKIYCFWVRRFLTTLCGTAAPDWSTLSGSHLTAFVRKEASRLQGNGREAPGVALRVLLRYLSFRGVVRDDLESSVTLLRNRSAGSALKP